jgi:cellulose synthase/poly-beta-1,6-N-acetylglucosamine synthase-like glycosyltransferase
MKILIVLLGGLYWWIISNYIHHWKRIPGRSVLSEKRQSVTIIVPFRNEAAHLPGLIESLKAQEYPSALMQIVLVDDHSEDNGAEYLKNVIDDRITLIINDKDKSGKKSALEKGMSVVESDLVLFTDADTIRGPQWVNEMVMSLIENNADMVAGPTLGCHNESRYAPYFQLELAGLSTVTGGAIKGRLHGLANGANMLVKCSALPKVDPFNKMASVSGDDLFLAEHFFNENTLAFNKSLDAAVYTFAPEDYKSLVLQKVRWAGKFNHIKGFKPKAAMGVLGLTPLFILTAMIASVFYDYIYMWYGLALLLTKWVADYRLIRSNMLWQGLDVRPMQVLGHEFTNLTLFGHTLLYLFLKKKNIWKGREI